MKVVLINHSDNLGGAAVASLRLMEALRLEGVDARMLVTDNRCGLSIVAPLGGRWGNKWRFLWERLLIFLRNGLSRATLFKIDTGSTGTDVSRHPWVREADVVILNWVNQGTLSLGDVHRLGRLGKPIIWVMHDMWNCTGICHHAYECKQYATQCVSCPLTVGRGSLASSTQKRKRALYKNVPMTFVAVSNWLADCCRKSSLMSEERVLVIPNPFPTSDYSWERRHDADICQAPTDSVVIVMGAYRLDDPVKGLDLLIETSQYIAQEKPSLARRLHLLLYGDIRDKSLLDRLALSYTYLGFISDTNRVMANADIVLSTAYYESFGLTLVEGLASGCVAVTTGAGGQVDIVKHGENGYVIGKRQAADVAQGIEWAVNAKISRETLHKFVAEKFDCAVVAKRYKELFGTLLNPV